MINGGPYIGSGEDRRNTRYAVIESLAMRGYYPVDSEHIGHAKINLNESETMIIPFEWFHNGTQNKSDSDSGKRLLLVWLDEEKLKYKSPQSNPMGIAENINNIFHELTYPVKYTNTINIIGPTSSSALLELKKNLESGYHSSGDYCCDKNWLGYKADLDIHIISPLATVSNIFDKSKPYCSISKPYCSIVNSCEYSKKEFESIIIGDLLITPIDTKYKITRIGADNAMLAEKLKSELLNDRRFEKDNIVLIGQLDNEYSRDLKAQICRELSGDPSTDCHLIKSYDFLRGLDGKIPQDTNKSNPTSGSPPTPSATASSPNTLPTDRAEGDDQFDYLRRLSDELESKDHQLRKTTGTGIQAIGIIGNDYYDKLAILSVLKPKLKETLFFTTQMDANMFIPQDNQHTRNLVVASPYPLNPTGILKGETSLTFTPIPFRNSNQTGVYLAVQQALDITDTNLKEEGYLFEIGRTEAVELTPGGKPNDTPLPIQEEKMQLDWNSNLPPNVIYLLLSFCTSMAMIYIMAWRWIHPLFFIIIIIIIFVALYLMYQIFEYSLCQIIKVIFVVLLCLIVWIIYLCYEKIISWFINIVCEVKIPSHVEEFFDKIATHSFLPRETLRNVFYFIVFYGVLWAIGYVIHGQNNPEPFRWFEGVSIWPSEMIGLLALSLSVMFICRLHDITAESDRQTKARFLIGDPDKKDIDPSPVHAEYNLDKFIEKSKKPEKENSTECKPKSTNTIWYEYSEEKQNLRWLAVLYAVIFLLICVSFIKAWGMPTTPTRGLDNIKYDKYFTILIVLVFLILIFYVNNVISRLTRLAKNLWQENPWSKESLANYGFNQNLQSAFSGNFHNSSNPINWWLDIQLIAHCTKGMKNIILYPVIVLVLIFFARSSIFDAWTIPWQLLTVFLASLTVIILSGIRLSWAAESTREHAIESMKQALQRLKAEESVNPQINVACKRLETSKLTDLVEYLINDAKSIDTGAFAPLTQQSYFQALLAITASLSSLQLLHYFQFS